MGLGLLTCWDCGFEFHWGHGCPSLVRVSVVCYYTERSLQWAGHSCRGVLPSVIMKPQQ